MTSTIMRRVCSSFKKVFAKLSIEKEEEEEENEEKLLKKNKESSRAKIGKYIKVRTLCQGEYFGEEEIIENCPRKYKIICNSFEGKTLMIRKDHFLSNVFQDEISKKYIETRLKEKEANIEQRISNMRNSLKQYQSYLFPPNSGNTPSQPPLIKALNESQVLPQSLTSVDQKKDKLPSTTRYRQALISGQQSQQLYENGSLRGLSNSPKKSQSSFTSFEQLEVGQLSPQKNSSSYNRPSQMFTCSTEQSQQQQQSRINSMILDDIISSPISKNRQLHKPSLEPIDPFPRISQNLISSTNLGEKTQNPQRRESSSTSFTFLSQNAADASPSKSNSQLSNVEPNNNPGGTQFSLLKLIPTKPSGNSPQQEAIQLKDQLLKDYRKSMLISQISQKNPDQKLTNSQINAGIQNKSKSFTLNDNVFLSLSPVGKTQKNFENTNEQSQQTFSLAKENYSKFTGGAQTSRNNKESNSKGKAHRHSNSELGVFSENKTENSQNIIENLLSERDECFSPFLKKRLKSITKPQLHFYEEPQIKNKEYYFKQILSRIPGSQKHSSFGIVDQVNSSQMVEIKKIDEKHAQDIVQDSFNIRSFKLGNPGNALANSTNNIRNRITCINNSVSTTNINQSISLMDNNTQQLQSNNKLETFGIAQDLFEKEQKQLNEAESLKTNQLKYGLSSRKNNQSPNKSMFNSASQCSNTLISQGDNKIESGQKLLNKSPQKRLGSFVFQHQPSPSDAYLQDSLTIKSVKNAESSDNNIKDFFEQKHKLFASLLNKEKMKIQAPKQIEMLEKNKESTTATAATTTTPTPIRSQYFLGNLQLREKITKTGLQDSSGSISIPKLSFSILPNSSTSQHINAQGQQVSPSQIDRIHSKNPGSCSPRAAKYKLRSVIEKKEK